jgi:peptidoglycan hydrolase CwlO-like protein
MSETRVRSGARCLARRSLMASFLLAFLGCSALAGVASSGPAAADQVGSLKTQAKTISEELVQEQLQAGAYQQQYSVASARVAKDQSAIASLQTEIKSDRHQVTKRLHQVQRLAVESYVLNGSVSSGSGAALFAENVSTVQSANEYATISIGNLNEAVEGLQTAKRNEQSQQQSLVRQRTLDQSVQNQQASYLAQANASVQRMQSVQAQVTGQLAVAVAQQNAALARAAAAAVTTARKATVQRSSGSSTPSSSTATATAPSSGATPAPTNTTDPALPPFLACVVQAESGGNYQAVSPNGLYRGAFQFSQSTWNFAAEEAHRPDLVGVPPNQASKADQDTLAVTLFTLDGERPWLGDRCSA